MSRVIKCYFTHFKIFNMKLLQEIKKRMQVIPQLELAKSCRNCKFHSEKDMHCLLRNDKTLYMFVCKSHDMIDDPMWLKLLAKYNNK